MPSARLLKGDFLFGVCECDFATVGLSDELDPVLFARSEVVILGHRQ